MPAVATFLGNKWRQTVSSRPLHTLIFGSVLLLALLPAARAVGQELQLQDARLERQLPANARWALTVLDLESGREISTGNAGREQLVPGSLMKLFIAGAILERAATGDPPDLTTILAHDGELRDGTLWGNLYLQE